MCPLLWQQIDDTNTQQKHKNTQIHCEIDSKEQVVSTVVATGGWLVSWKRNVSQIGICWNIRQTHPNVRLTIAPGSNRHSSSSRDTIYVKVGNPMYSYRLTARICVDQCYNKWLELIVQNVLLMIWNGEYCCVQVVISIEALWKMHFWTIIRTIHFWNYTSEAVKSLSWLRHFEASSYN